MSSRNDAEPSVKLFEGEKWLVVTGVLGFVLAAGIALYIFFQGGIIPPEGDLGNAFSFNAAIGIFILSIAAILPLARYGARKRKIFRWLFIFATLYGYAIETIQNFRGLNQRFSREGSLLDMISGMLFGVISLMLVVLGILLLIQFFRLRYPYERPLLVLGIRYAFISVLIANISGLWMIVLQDRFTGEMGNIIVLHGMGFHALQTLVILGWLLERVQLNEHMKKMLLHYGSISWMLSMMLVGLQTALGRSVFELTTLPIISGLLLLVWLATVVVASVLFIKEWRTNTLKTDSTISKQA